MTYDITRRDLFAGLAAAPIALAIPATAPAATLAPVAPKPNAPSIIPQWASWANRKILRPTSCECERCNGTGEIECPDCGGEGRWDEEQPEDQTAYEYPPSAAAFIKTKEDLDQWREAQR